MSESVGTAPTCLGGFVEQGCCAPRRAWRVLPLAAVLAYFPAMAAAGGGQGAFGGSTFLGLVSSVDLPATASLKIVAIGLLVVWLVWRNFSVQARARRQAKAARDTVTQREYEISAILSNVNALLFSTDTEGVLRFTNASWSALLEKRSEDLLGQPLANIVEPQSRKCVERLFTAPLPSMGGTVRVGMRGQRGERRMFDLTVRALPDTAPCARGFVGSAIDVSGLVRARSKLRALLQFGASMIESSPLPTAVCDNQNLLTQVNRAWEAHTGLSRGNVLGKPIILVWPELMLPVTTEEDARTLETGGVVQYEVRCLRHDGSQRDLFVSRSAMPPAMDGHLGGSLLVFMDVSQFREAERQTRLAIAAGESNFHMKSEFIGNISHELRTPLQSILGFAELAISRGRNCEPEALIDMLRTIELAGQRMLALVNNLLDLSKMEDAFGVLDIERHDIRPLLRSVAAEFFPLLSKKQLELKFTVPPVPIVAMVDPVRFQQVIRNLLANAIRFSPQGGKIDLIGQMAEDVYAEIFVIDQGPGIPEAELCAIFQPFVQSSETKTGAGGTGLGLAICRKIMALHEGSISAENRPGVGAVFHIRIPVARFGDTIPASL